MPQSGSVMQGSSSNSAAKAGSASAVCSCTRGGSGGEPPRAWLGCAPSHTLLLCPWEFAVVVLLPLPVADWRMADGGGTVVKVS